MKYSRVFLVSFLLVVGSPIAAAAQSQDRDNPTPLTSNLIKGNGVGKKVEYFYSFTAGPGELVVLIGLKAAAGSTGAEVEIFDADSSKIFFYYPNATTTVERAVKRVTINTKQLVTLRLALDNNAGEYAIKLGGAFEQATVTSPSEPAAPGVEAPNPSASAEVQQPVTSETDSGASSAIPAETSVAKSGKGSKLNLGMNILQAVGTQFGLPTSGLLHLVMKDGTVQDIDLSKVKSASVAKQ